MPTFYAGQTDYIEKLNELAGGSTIPPTGVTAGTYGSATQIPSFTVGTDGRLSAASNIALTMGWSDVTSKPTTVSGFGITDALTTSYVPTWASVTGKPTFATVATSGNYTDLIGTPSLAAVATTGSYSDLSGTPSPYSLPTASTTVLGGVKVDGTTVTISGGVISSSASGTAVTVKDEGTNLTTSLASLNFVGAGVVATNTGSDVTVTISGAGGAGVSDVTATSPVLSSGGATPNISLPQATTSVNGYLTSTDWNTFNGKLSSVPTTAVVAGTYGSATKTVTYTVGADGRLTASSEQTVTPAWADITGKPSFATVATTGAYSDLTGTPDITSSKTAKTFFAAPNAAAGVPSFRLIVASDIPTLNQNTTGTAANVTGIVTGATGGTGVNNSGRTLTLGGNHTNSGAFASTFTMVGATTVTFPTSGTLSTLAGAETLTNKTLTNPVINNPTGITKANVGLSNVDNTSDASKPVSTATQTALDAKQATLVSGTNIKTVGGVSLLGSGDISGGGGSLVRLGGEVLSSSASAAFTSIFTSTYSRYLITVDLKDNGSGTAVLLELYDGSTYLNYGYLGQIQTIATGGSSYNFTPSSTSLLNLTPSAGNEVVSLSINVTGVASGEETRFVWQGMTVDASASGANEAKGFGFNSRTVAVQGFRIKRTSGSMTGDIQIYGYAKT